MKTKHLLLLGTMTLALTACSQTAPVTEETTNAEQESTVTEAAEETVSETEEDESSVEETTTVETQDSASSQKQEQPESSLLSSPEIAFKQNGDIPFETLYTDLKTSFEENAFTDYLFNNFSFFEGDSEIVHHATIFGFNVPKGYESDISKDDKQAFRITDFQESTYPEYPGRYAFLNPEDYSSLYLFRYRDKADDIRDYLQNGTALSRVNTDQDTSYPTFLTDDSVILLENMDTVNTVYGSCDILFMELESPDSRLLDYCEVTNPIYIEAAYFSPKTYYTYYDEVDSAKENPHCTLQNSDIAIIYMYPDSNSETVYEGHLAQLLPDMLTPAAQ